jgi:hypothetical protein
MSLLDLAVQYVTKLKRDDPNESVLSMCLDFIQEETCLMYLEERRNVEVDRSTKCDPELAGEGIEYTWDG